MEKDQPFPTRQACKGTTSWGHRLTVTFAVERLIHEEGWEQSRHRGIEPSKCARCHLSQKDIRMPHGERMGVPAPHQHYSPAYSWGGAG